MPIEAAGRSDVGQQREDNEDSFCILPEYDLFVVADGMGGHRAGDVASRMATHVIASFFWQSAREDTTWPFHFDPTLSSDENRLVTSIRVANKRIYDASMRSRDVSNMGTTVVSAVLSKERDKVYVAHVGDSRAYRVRNGSIAQITKDHSLLNEYLQVMPEMSQEQQNQVPKNVITRALGMSDQVVVELTPDAPQPGDIYILCSDGLSGMIEDDGILALAQENKDSIEKIADALIKKANENGGEDNVTVVVFRI